jgi:hypothetical protein
MERRAAPHQMNFSSFSPLATPIAHFIKTGLVPLSANRPAQHPETV